MYKKSVKAERSDIALLVFDKCQTPSYHCGDEEQIMKQIEISTRELLRNFKKYKQMLLDREAQSINLPLDNGEKITISLIEPKNTGANIAAAIRALKKPIKVERPKGFLDDLFSRKIDL